jgi:hypothetical protein
MNHYEIWCDLKDGRKNLEFAQEFSAYLGRLQELGRIAHFRVTRLKNWRHAHRAVFPQTR